MNDWDLFGAEEEIGFSIPTGGNASTKRSRCLIVRDSIDDF